MAAWGIYILGVAGSAGVALIACGVFLVALDIVIDVIWAHPEVSRSDHPDLNRRGLQLVGRTARVVDAISDGRGRIVVGDTLWTAEGPDAPSGARVRIVAERQGVLIVERE